MEQITTYTVKLETNDVWVFKHSLNGLLVGFEVLEGELSQKQFDWLFVSAKIPIHESMINEWRKQPKLQIILNQPDISFENFWKLYGLKVKKETSEKAFNKLSDAEKIKCFLALRKYNKELQRTGQAKAHMITWINQKRYNDEY